jgi:hypothetical protein
MKYFKFTLLLILFMQQALAQNDSIASKERIDAALKAMEEDSIKSSTQRPSLSFNPDIGLIGDFQGYYTSKGDKNVDAYLNETELSFQSVVDPYIRADVFISLSRDPQTHEYGAEVEEGYLTTLTLPYRLQLRAGKFRQSVGRINNVHPHALPFVDMPDAYVNYFGNEGLNDEGISLSWLLPTTPFYQELVFETTTGRNDAPYFYRGDNNRLQYLAHLKNVFTVNSNSTLELGLTGITGGNEYNSVTNIGAADLTYKWKPVQMNTYHSLTWQSEFYFGNIDYYNIGDYNSFGLYSFIEYQIAKRWFLCARYDYAQEPLNNSVIDHSESLTGSCQLSEFHRIQLESKITNNGQQSTFVQGWIRWIFIIGAHGAHRY